MSITLTQFQTLLETSLRLLCEREEHIMVRRVNEVCINHRFANYLERTAKSLPGFSWINVDLEYNKNYDDRKVILTEIGEKSIRPDIIIHWRGDNFRNLAAFECKIGYTNRNDILKLTSLLCEPYNYDFTCAVSYLPERNHMLVKVFSTGEQLRFWFNKEKKNLQRLEKVNVSAGFIA